MLSSCGGGGSSGSQDMSIPPETDNDDLLNETAAGDTNLNSGNAPVSLSQPFATGAPLPMDTTGMPDSVANAVTRDYSSLMKAIDKKKGR